MHRKTCNPAAKGNSSAVYLDAFERVRLALESRHDPGRGPGALQHEREDEVGEGVRHHVCDVLARDVRVVGGLRASTERTQGPSGAHE